MWASVAGPNAVVPSLNGTEGLHKSATRKCSTYMCHRLAEPPTRYLWLPVRSMKLERYSLLGALPAAMAFVLHHLEHGRKVLIVDKGGAPTSLHCLFTTAVIGLVGQPQYQSIFINQTFRGELLQQICTIGSILSDWRASTSKRGPIVSSARGCVLGLHLVH